MNNKKMYIVIAVSILVVAIGVSLAYFGVTIIGNDTAKSNKVVTGNLELTFTDTNEISLDGMFPGDSIEKTISVKNTGSKDSSYNLIWTELNNGIINDELVIEATCVRLNSSGTEEGTCAGIEETPISSKTLKKKISIETKVTHQYNLKITFIDTGKPQNYNKNKTFSGKLGISESADTAIYCNSNNSSLTQGTEYVNGQYTYRYKQEGTFAISGLEWQNITADGWGVQLTDRTSTTAVTSELCTYIDNKPVVSMNNMFASTAATSIDLSSFDTSNVTNMGMMFMLSPATSIDLSGFDTSNVTDMSDMFLGSQAIALNVSNFDTSKVTNMKGMLSWSKATTLDISNFDTSKVTNMNAMFRQSSATALDLSSFDTSNVTNMSFMFYGTEATILDVSNFDTSKVTNMSDMFDASYSLKTIYVSSKFVTTAVTNSKDMFTSCTKLVGGAGTKYNSSYVDKTYARIDGGTSNPGYFTDVTDKPKDPISFANDSWKTIANAVKNNNISKYNVGDTKTIDMGTYGTHTLRIANTSTPSECSTTGFSQSACGFVLEFVDIITTYYMNPSGTYDGTNYSMGWNKDGWPVTAMRTLVNNDIYNALPNEIKNAIIDTTVVSGHGPSDTTNFTSTDKLYLLAPGEVWSDWKTSDASSYDTAKDLTRTLDYYTAQGVTTENRSPAIKNNDGSAELWYLRTAYSSRNIAFFIVWNDGRCSTSYASNVLIAVTGHPSLFHPIE